MPDLSAMTARWTALRQDIVRACQANDRNPDEVSVLPISKTFTIDAIEQAMALGFTRFGENRMQEVRDKAEAMGEGAPQWVVIGPVQTNKARDVARHATELQTLDRLELAEALERRLDAAGRSLDVLVQVKTAVEASKHGLAPDELPSFLQTISSQYKTLRVRGLMTVATQSDSEAVVRACFCELRTWRDRVRELGLDDVGLDRLSMGMSSDYAWAIAEGSTELRIGSALFGGRVYA